MDDFPRPDVVSTMIESKSNCTIKFYAYRKLTRQEMIQGLHIWMNQNRRKSLPKNGSIKVITIHGHDE